MGRGLLSSDTSIQANISTIINRGDRVLPSLRDSQSDIKLAVLARLGDGYSSPNRGDVRVEKEGEGSTILIEVLTDSVLRASSATIRDGFHGDERGVGSG